MIGIDYMVQPFVFVIDFSGYFAKVYLRKKIQKCYNPYYEVTCSHCRYTGNIGEASVASGH